MTKMLFKRKIKLKLVYKDLDNYDFDRQQMQEALPQAEEKYRHIFDNVCEGIYQTTPDGRYLTANQGLAKIYGYSSPEELITKIEHIGKVYVDPNSYEKLLHLLEQGEIVSGFESQVYRQNSEKIWISEKVLVVRDRNGSPLYYESFVTDISERKLLEQTQQELQRTKDLLLQSEKMSSLGNMLAGVAHEINNPVNFVCGNFIHATQYAEDLLNLIELYQQHYPDPVPEIQDEAEAIELDFLADDFPKTLSSMQMGAERIRAIVNSLRNFSRTDDTQLTAIDLHEGIDGTLLILNNRLKARGAKPGIAVLKEYGNLPLVPCYPGLINQVFMNLLSNAIDALDEYSEKEQQAGEQEKGSLLPAIRITTKLLENDWVVIMIADNGPGMTEEVKSQIFDAFFTTKPIGKGTGLGLAISYQIVVEKHGGHLKCSSVPNEGTEFAIELPLQH